MSKLTRVTVASILDDEGVRHYALNSASLFRKFGYRALSIISGVRDEDGVVYVPVTMVAPSPEEIQAAAREAKEQEMYQTIKGKLTKEEWEWLNT